MITKKYPCTQAELYAITRIGWRNFLNLIGFFTAFKTFYDAAYLAASIAQINAAEAMPDSSVRAAKITNRRIKLVSVAEVARNKWQDIKSYINDGFPETERENKYQEAGGAHYFQAGQDNWEEVEALMVDGAAFIAANAAALTTGGMPAGFPAAFATAKSTFDAALFAFYNEEELEGDVADDKGVANNALFERLMSMLTDGQKIFRNDEGKHKMFVFDHLLNLVSNSLANITGEVFTGIAETPVEGVKITVLELDSFVLTDADGRFDFGAVPAGTYTLVLEKEGFATITKPNVEVKTGTTDREEFLLMAA